MNGQNQLEDELQTRVLSDVSFIETFAVELDARNVMGCQGPPLDYSKDSKKTDLLWSLVERGIHVRKACKTSDSDIEMEIRMNNYLDFLKPDARKRFRWLLQREKNQSFTRSWQCCTPCEHTQPSANDAARNGAAHTHEEESANKKAATTVSREAADPSSSSIKTFKFSGQPPMQCPYCQFSSKKVRSFVNHLSQCEKADPSIRAKTQPIPSIGCVYGCKLSLQRYDQHDRELHYLCGCQKFIDRRSQTRTHRCDDPDQHQAWVAIDPVQYFTFKILKNRAESPRPDSQVHEDEKQSSDSVECSGSMRSSQDNHRIELQPDTLSNTTQGLSHEHFVGNTNHTGMVRMNSVASTTSPRTRLSSMFSIGDQPTTVAESPDCSASITDADSIGSHGEARSSAATPMASGSVSLVDPVVTRRRKLSVTSAGTKMADTINVNTNFNIDDVEVAIFGSGSALRQNDSSPPCDPLSLEGSEFSSKRSVDDDPVASPQGTKRAKLGGTRSFSVHEAGNSTIESSQHMSQLVELSASLDSDAAVSRSARECFSATPGKPGDIHQVFERNDKIKANQQHIPINSSLEQAEGTPNMESKYNVNHSILHVFLSFCIT